MKPALMNGTGAIKIQPRGWAESSDAGWADGSGGTLIKLMAAEGVSPIKLMVAGQAGGC